MKYLVERYWETFKKDNNPKVFDGNKFEDLVSSLLEEIFSGNWQGTQKTWDGGKDFYKEDDTGLDWAECKIYKSNLDIKIIGKTLVMVIINDNVKNLYFFSYSPMVSTAYEHLAQFSKNSNINIIVYDDTKLEELILKTVKTKEDYFNNFTLSNYKFDNKDTVYTNISKDIEISILEVENFNKYQERKEKFLYNQTFVLEIIIINNSTEYKKYKFDFSNFTNSGISLWLISDLNSLKYNNLELQGCEIKSINIFLKSRSVGKTTIPTINIESTENNGTVDIISTQKKDIEIIFISHPTLVGLQLEKIITNFEVDISSNNKLMLHIISGTSGVGKSRLSNEFIDKLLKQNYSIFKYDCNSPEHYLLQNFIQKLLSYLYKIPIVHDVPEDQEFDLLTTLIKGTSSISNSDINNIIELIITGIKKYRLSLVIDNIQSLESMSFEFLSKLYKKLYKLSLQTSFVFIFNLDELAFNTASKIFFNELKDDNRNKQILLNEFKDFEAKQFIDNLIKFEDNNIRFSEQYPETIKLIIEHVGLKALNLFQTILYLSDENIITIKNDYFIVNDVNNFYYAIVDLNTNIETILEKRYSYLEKEYNELVYALKYISFFEELEWLDIENSSIKNSINKLIKINLLKENNGVISFYHGSIKKFMYKKEFWHDADLVKNIVSDKKEFYFEYLLVDYICCLIDTVDKSSYMNKIFDFLMNTKLKPNLQTNLFAILLEKELRKNKKYCFLDYKEELIIINKILPFLTFNLKVEDKVDIFKKIYIHRFSSFDLYASSYRELSLILRAYSSWSCQINKAQEGYDEIEKFLDKIEITNLESDQVYRVKADLKNRQCVNLKFLGKFSAAEIKGLESLSISQKHNFKTEECLNYIDLGYIFFGCNKNTTLLIKYWRQAVEVYNKHSAEICKYNFDMKYAAMLIEVHLMILNKEEKAFSKISDLIQLCKFEYSDYYLKQSLMLDIINNFIHKHFDNIINKINNVKDLSIATNEVKFYQKALFAESKYFYFCNEYERSIEILKYILYDINKLNKRFVDSNFCLIKDFIQQCKQMPTYDCNIMNQIFQISNLTESDYLDNDITTTFNIDGICLPLP